MYQGRLLPAHRSVIQQAIREDVQFFGFRLSADEREAWLSLAEDLAP